MHTHMQASIHARYKDELLAQIAANEERRKLDRHQYLEEGRRMREVAELEKLKLQVGVRGVRVRGGTREWAGIPAPSGRDWLMGMSTSVG
jgi:hypothetical protein